MKTLLFLACALALSLPATSPSGTCQDTDPPYTAERLEQAIKSEINRQRRANGLQPYRVDAELSAIARAHSRYMADNNDFGHTTQSGQGPAERLAAAGYTCRREWNGMVSNGVSENIIMQITGSTTHYWDDTGNSASRINYYSLREMVTNVVIGSGNQYMVSWMESPGHRNNILDERRELIGVGVAWTPEGRFYATMKVC